MLSANSLLIAQLIGMLPDEQATVMRGRIALCESVAMSCTTMVNRDETELASQYLWRSRRRIASPQCCAAASSGAILLQVGNHRKYWHRNPGQGSWFTNILVPISSPTSKWGDLEVPRSCPRNDFVWVSRFQVHTTLSLCIGLQWAYVHIPFAKVLAQLDPSKVVPGGECVRPSMHWPRGSWYLTTRRESFWRTRRSPKPLASSPKRCWVDMRLIFNGRSVPTRPPFRGVTRQSVSCSKWAYRLGS